jgi:Ran GTPase-activating protein (RanGAP) involved in mRNA processing and transport
LWVNSINSEGAGALADMLKHNAVLTTLYLGDNRVGDSGAKSLAQALKVNTALTTLELWHNNIGAEGARALGEVLKNNSALSLDLGATASVTRGRPERQRSSARLKTPRR